jgi:hypothetical protein
MPPSATVAELKANLQPRTGVLCAHQKVMYKQVLSDGAALASVGVRAGAKLMLMGRATLPVTVVADGGALVSQPVAREQATAASSGAHPSASAAPSAAEPSQLMAELAAERRARHGSGASLDFSHLLGSKADTAAAAEQQQEEEDGDADAHPGCAGGTRPKGKGKGKGTTIRREPETFRDRQAKALAAVEDEEDLDALLEALQIATGVDWCVRVISERGREGLCVSVRTRVSQHRVGE